MIKLPNCQTLIQNNDMLPYKDIISGKNNTFQVAIISNIRSSQTTQEIDRANDEDSCQVKRN